MAATIGDVAERAKVSTATVSRVLAGIGRARPETEARVLATQMGQVVLVVTVTETLVAVRQV